MASRSRNGNGAEFAISNGQAVFDCGRILSVRFVSQKGLCSLKAVIVGLTSLIVGGCGGLQTQSDPHELVERRSLAHAQALIDGDFKKALQYTTPAFRKGRGMEYYTRSYAGASSWNKAEIKNVTCSGDRCDVTVMINYQAYRAGFENMRSMEERWIKVDGGWYLYLQ